MMAMPSIPCQASHANVNFTIYGDMDKDVFKKGNQTPKTKIDLVKQLLSERQLFIKIQLVNLKAQRMTWKMTYIRIPVNPCLKRRKPVALVVKMQEWVTWVMMFNKTLPWSLNLRNDQFGDDVYQDPLQP